MPLPSNLTPSLEPNFGAMATQAMISAMELGLMQRLADGPATVQTLARSARANPRAVRMLLDALVGLGQLEKQGVRYRLAQELAEMLRSPGVDPETYFQDCLKHMKQIVANWSQLSDVVKNGQPVMHVGVHTDGEKVFPILARRLFPRNYMAAKELFKQLPQDFRRNTLRVLDIGAGSAAWSIPFAEANHSSEVVAVDFAPVLEVTRHFTRSCGVEHQYQFMPGDIRRIRFGTAQYDVALLGHICHSEGATRTRRLFRKMHRALRPKGLMLVADFVADESRSGRSGGAFPLLFALNMLVHTEQGDTFTLSEYRRWATEAGFRRFRSINVSAPSPVMLFQK